MRLSPRQVAVLIALGIAVPAASSLAIPASASAGEYHVYSCRLPDGKPAPTDGWEIAPRESSEYGEGMAPPVIDPAWQGWVRSCPAGGGFGLVVDPNTTGGGSITRLGALRFAPGGGLVISRGTLYRAASTYGNAAADILYSQSGGGLDALFGDSVLDHTGSGESRGNLASPTSPANRITFPVSGTGPNGEPSQTPAKPLNYLRLRARCWNSDASCGGGATLQLFASDLILVDAIGPTVDLAGGTIIEEEGEAKGSLTSRVLSGNEAVTVSATDAGIGVDRIRVEVDGKTVSEGLLRHQKTGVACKMVAPASDGLPAATSPRPCPGTGTGTAAIDTSKIPDGAHDLRVSVVDATGNSTVVASGRVLTRNGGAIGPGSPNEFRGAANGRVGGNLVAGDTASLTLVWPETGRSPSSRKSVQKKCAKSERYRNKHRLACGGRAPAATLNRRWSRAKTSQLRGRLVDPAGQPIAEAQVELVETATVLGATPKPMATLTTDADGAFVASVAHARGSRLIQARWKSRANDTVPSASADATVAVAAATGINAPKRAGRGRTVTFTGTLRGEDGARNAVPITLQVRYAGRWKTFANAGTDANGKWRVKVKKFATQRGRYPVKAIVGTSTTYPYAAGGGTRVVTVRVR